MADAGIPTTRLTRRIIRRRIGEITGWEVWGGLGGKATGGGTAATLLDTDLYSSALDQKIRRRDYFLMLDSGTDQADSGKWRYITTTVDSSGTIAWSGDMAGNTGDNDEYEVWAGEGPNPDVLHQCIDRALQDACWYWRLTPLTMLRGGDVGDELVVSANDIDEFVAGGTELFGDVNATVTLEELEPPEEFVRRAIRVEASAANGYAQSAIIEVDPEDRGSWHIQALMRSMATVAGADAGTGGAKIVVWDMTNGAAISLDDTDDMTTTSRGWKFLKSNFTIPDTCYQFVVRLQTVTNGEFSEFAWVQLAERNQTRFALPRRINTKRRIGPVYERVGQEYGEFHRAVWDGTVERREMQGRGVSLHLSPSPGTRSLWYYEKVNFPKLTSPYTGGEGGGATLGLDDDNVTWCPLEWVVQAALVECYKFLRRRDKNEMPERWLEELDEAQVELSAMQDDYGIEGMLVEDSPKPWGSVILEV